MSTGGAQTQRSLLHFKHWARYHASGIDPARLGTLKKACALVNQDLGKLPADKAKN